VWRIDQRDFKVNLINSGEKHLEVVKSFDEEKLLTDTIADSHIERKETLQMISRETIQ